MLIVLLYQRESRISFYFTVYLYVCEKQELPLCVFAQICQLFPWACQQLCTHCKCLYFCSFGFSTFCSFTHQGCCIPRCTWACIDCNNFFHRISSIQTNRIKCTDCITKQHKKTEVYTSVRLFVPLSSAVFVKSHIVFKGYPQQHSLRQQQFLAMNETSAVYAAESFEMTVLSSVSTMFCANIAYPFSTLFTKTCVTAPASLPS